MSNVELATSTTTKTGFLTTWQRITERPAFRLILEILLVVPAYLLYQLVRAQVTGRTGDAFANARDVISIERRLGIFWEADLQGVILAKDFLVDLFSYVYIWGHLPVIIVTAVAIFIWRRERYAFFRNAFLISGAISLIIFGLVPLAPPRLFPGLGFADTVPDVQSYYIFQNPQIVNPYAAMPSLHFGWDLLVAIAIITSTRNPLLRGLALVMPVLSLLGVVMTANHYFLDVMGGAGVAALGLAIAWVIRKSVPRGLPFSFLA
ncbi:MAG: phosphatase PAP2 family protein [Chloroflexi bacterium]|nr:phosphatase PAP2 family protein [Chloroflexota bacterium]